MNARESKRASFAARDDRAIREHCGRRQAWLDFFLEGVAQTAAGAVDTAHRLLAMFEQDAERIQDLGCAAANALRVFNALRRRPVAGIDHLVRHTGVAYPTAARAVDALVGLGLLRELTGRQRGRVFAMTVIWPSSTRARSRCDPLISRVPLWGIAGSKGSSVWPAALTSLMLMSKNTQHG